MENQTTLSILFLSFCLSLLLIINTSREVRAEINDDDHDNYRHVFGKRKLFVFGDSYADTGNSKRSTAVSWKVPYGTSFPGKPAGRFSDGRVLTDYLASFLDIKSPLPYRWIKSAKKPKLKYGMNFAFGGTGVFNTMEKEPNMSLQINFFEEIIHQKNYTKNALNSSVALLSLAGNDYAAYLANKGGNLNIEKGLENVSTSIVKQLVVNVKRIRSLGVGKIAVTSLEPLGCLPPFTASSSYQNCSKTWNSVSDLHNQILKQNLQNLSKQSDHDFVVLLDLYDAFMSAFKSMQENTTGNKTLENYNPVLKPCCVGVSNGYSCGSVDGNGTKKYSVCQNPELSFFWDIIHPSQNGWTLVFSALRKSLHKLFA